MNDRGVTLPFDLEQRPAHGYPLIHVGGRVQTHDGRELLGSKVVPDGDRIGGNDQQPDGERALDMRQRGQGDGVLPHDHGSESPRLDD